MTETPASATTEAPAPPRPVVAVPAETVAGETRAAAAPRSVRALVTAGADVRVQQGAGEKAGITDSEYEQAGATLAKTLPDTVKGAALVLTVRPTAALVKAVPPGCAIVGMLDPLGKGAELVEAMAARKVDAFALELLPRITRAQEMDVLSSMANISGYWAVLSAAVRAPRMFPLLTTAAGTVSPAKVLILGAGVAGLSAIATAQRLGAVVEGYDVRPETREQVESLGARFVSSSVEAVGEGGYAKELTADAAERERQTLARHCAQSDIVVTTAQVPGRRAPLLITESMVQGMKPGSVIVDLAGATGGNCALSKAGEEVISGGVIITAPLEIPTHVAVHATQLYSNNVAKFAAHLLRDGAVRIDLDDEITGKTCVSRDGAVRGPSQAPAPAPEPAAAPAEGAADPAPVEETSA